MLARSVLYLGDDDREGAIRKAFRADEIKAHSTLGPLVAIRSDSYQMVLERLTAYFYGLDLYARGSGVPPLDFELVILDVGFPKEPSGGLKIWRELGPQVREWLLPSYVAVLTKYDPHSSPPTPAGNAANELLQLLRQEKGEELCGLYLFGNSDDVVNLVDNVFGN